MNTRSRSRLHAGTALACLVLTAALLTACGAGAASSRPGATTAPGAAASQPAPTVAATTTPTRVTATPATASVPSLRSAAQVRCTENSDSADCVAPGTYRLDESIPPGTVTLDVPGGWFEWDPGGGTEGLLVNGGRDAPDGSGWGILLSPLAGLSVDPCDPSKGETSASRLGTPEKVAAIMAGWPGFHPTAAPQTARVGGIDGRMVELTYTGQPGTCAGARLWTTTDGSGVDGYPMIGGSATRPTQFYVLDTGGGQLLVIRTSSYPQQSPFEEEQGVSGQRTRHALDQVALRGILDSIRFTP
jgi:hypothetical protein